MRTQYGEPRLRSRTSGDEHGLVPVGADSVLCPNPSPWAGISPLMLRILDNAPILLWLPKCQISS